MYPYFLKHTTTQPTFIFTLQNATLKLLFKLFPNNMIAYLKGTIQYKDDKGIIVVVNNIGYLVGVPESVLMVKNIGDSIELYTYQKIHSRDESFEMFGFQTPDDLSFFKQLIGISGVGPRSALGVLSIATLEELTKTITHGDPALLTKVAGIGKKTAERVVIELKDKLATYTSTSSTHSSIDKEVYEALEGLGYETSDVREALRELSDELTSSEEKIKAALKVLAK